MRQWAHLVIISKCVSQIEPMHLIGVPLWLYKKLKIKPKYIRIICPPNTLHHWSTLLSNFQLLCRFVGASLIIFTFFETLPHTHEREGMSSLWLCKLECIHHCSYGSLTRFYMLLFHSFPCYSWVPQIQHIWYIHAFY